MKCYYCDGTGQAYGDKCYPCDGTGIHAASEIKMIPLGTFCDYCGNENKRCNCCGIVTCHNDCINPHCEVFKSSK